MKTVKAANKLRIEECISFTDSAAVLKVHPTMIYHWSKKNTDEPFLLSQLQVHPGQMSILHDIEGDLVDFVNEWRQKGLPVKCYNLMKKVIKLKLEFAAKS
jgi:hypothetical protein